jgi:hypothetical protein
VFVTLIVKLTLVEGTPSVTLLTFVTDIPVSEDKEFFGVGVSCTTTRHYLQAQDNHQVHSASRYRHEDNQEKLQFHPNHLNLEAPSPLSDRTYEQ